MQMIRIITLAGSCKTTDEKDACITQAQVARSLQLENEHALTGKGNPMEVAGLAGIREGDIAIFINMLNEWLD